MPAGEFCPEENIIQRVFMMIDSEDYDGATTADTRFTISPEKIMSSCTVHIAPETEPEPETETESEPESDTETESEPETESVTETESSDMDAVSETESSDMDAVSETEPENGDE